MSQKQDLREKITKMLNSDSVHSGDYRRVNDNEKFKFIATRTQKKPEIQAVENYLERVFGWIPANPSKPSVVAAIKKGYYLDQNSGINTVANSSKGAEHLKQILLKRFPEFIYLTGRQGVGKTCFTNYFVTTKSEELSKNNIVWFRVDYNKIYGDLQRFEGKDKYFLKYLDYQVAFVSFKYRENKHFKEFWAPRNTEAQKAWQTVYNKGGPANQQVHLSEISKLMQQLVAGISEEVDLHKRNFFEQFTDEARKLLPSCRKAFEIYAKAKNIKIMYILDGIDNLTPDRLIDLDIYSQMLSELASLVKGDKQGGGPETCYLLALRYDTLSELQSPPYLAHKSGDSVTFDIKNTNLQQLLNTKKTFATNKMPYCEEVSKSCRVEDGFDINAFITDLTLHLGVGEFIFQDFIQKVIDSINHVFPEKSYYRVTTENFLERVYDGNVRCLLLNFLNIFSFLMWYRGQGQEFEEVKNKKYLIREGQLLNGGLVYSSKKHINHVKGQVFPNIFNHMIRKGEETWHGLALVRILQYLSIRDRDVEDITTVMEKHFLYDKKEVKRLIISNVSFGLIRVISEEVEEKEKEKSYRLLYHTTDKGKFLINYIFLEPNLMYLCALDTPLPCQMTEGETQKITAYSFQEDRHYFQTFDQYSVISGLYFVQYILTADRKERSRDCFLAQTEADKKQFILPNNFPESLIEQYIKYITAIKNRVPARYNLILEELNKWT